MKSKSKLFISMMIKGLAGFLIIGLLLFGIAGTTDYPNGWMFIITLATLMLGMGLILLLKYSKTLERRLKAKETEKSQIIYVSIIGLLFVASFALAGFDYRYQWSNMPFGVAVFFLIVMICGYLLYGIVMFQNAYASRVIEVSSKQTVISNGIYALIRHPMYLATLLLFMSMPLVLGSYYALIPMLIFPVFLIMRIIGEEKYLRQHLPGYNEYLQKVKYRLLPFIW